LTDQQARATRPLRSTRVTGLRHYYEAVRPCDPWIRTSGAFDGVFDFDKATRDPQDPTRLLPAYDSGDHLHPSDAAYPAMANAVNLDALLDG
jgi:lysophospholipase L1-like esterase